MKSYEQFVNENYALVLASRNLPTLLRCYKIGRLATAAGFTVASFALGGFGGEKRIGGYYWVKDPSAEIYDTVIWKQVAPDRIPGFCSRNGDFDPRTRAKETASCAIGNIIFSRYSEDEAKLIRMSRDDNDTLWDHERRHVLQGLVHPHLK